jgi:hypothetical protein
MISGVLLIILWVAIFVLFNVMMTLTVRHHCEKRITANDDPLGTVLVLGIFLMATTGLLATHWHEEGYKSGQIEAANGTFHYFLQTNPDQTMEWIRTSKNVWSHVDWDALQEQKNASGN